LGLVGALTPVLYTHVANKKEEVADVNKANTMLNLQRETEQYIKKNGSGLDFSGGAIVMTPGQVVYPNNSTKANSYGLNNQYQIGLKKNADDSISAIIVEKQSSVSDVRSAKVASMIGTSAGITAGSDAYGINGLWKEGFEGYGISNVPAGTTVVTVSNNKEKTPFYSSDMIVNEDIDLGDNNINNAVLVADTLTLGGETRNSWSQYEAEFKDTGDAGSNADLIIFEKCQKVQSMPTDYCTIAFEKGLVSGCKSVEDVYDKAGLKAKSGFYYLYVGKSLKTVCYFKDNGDVPASAADIINGCKNTADVSRKYACMYDFQDSSTGKNAGGVLEGQKYTASCQSICTALGSGCGTAATGFYTITSSYSETGFEDNVPCVFGANKSVNNCAEVISQCNNGNAAACAAGYRYNCNRSCAQVKASGVTSSAFYKITTSESATVERACYFNSSNNLASASEAITACNSAGAGSVACGYAWYSGDSGTGWNRTCDQIRAVSVNFINQTNVLTNGLKTSSGTSSCCLANGSNATNNNSAYCCSGRRNYSDNKCVASCSYGTTSDNACCPSSLPYALGTVCYECGGDLYRGGTYQCAEGKGCNASHSCYTCACSGTNNRCVGSDIKGCDGCDYTTSTSCANGCDSSKVKCYDCTGSASICSTGTQVRKCVSGYYSYTNCSSGTPVCYAASATSASCVQCNQDSDCSTDYNYCATSTGAANSTGTYVYKKDYYCSSHACTSQNVQQASCSGKTPYCDNNGSVSGTVKCICKANSDCGSVTSTCNTTTQRKVVTPTCSNGACSDVTTYPDCSGTTPYCSNGTCVQCTDDSHCAAGAWCNNNVCTTAGGCTGTGWLTCNGTTRQYCNNHRITQTSACSGSTPYCYGGSCVACTSDSHCSGSTTYSCSGQTIQKTVPACSSSNTCTTATSNVTTCSGSNNSYCAAGKSSCVACTANSHCSGSTTYSCNGNTIRQTYPSCSSSNTCTTTTSNVTTCTGSNKSYCVAGKSSCQQCRGTSNASDCGSTTYSCNSSTKVRTTTTPVCSNYSCTTTSSTQNCAYGCDGTSCKTCECSGTGTTTTNSCSNGKLTTTKKTCNGCTYSTTTSTSNCACGCASTTACKGTVCTANSTTYTYGCYESGSYSYRSRTPQTCSSDGCTLTAGTTSNTWSKCSSKCCSGSGSSNSCVARTCTPSKSTTEYKCENNVRYKRTNTCSKTGCGYSSTGTWTKVSDCPCGCNGTSCKSTTCTANKTGYDYQCSGDYSQRRSKKCSSDGCSWGNYSSWSNYEYCDCGCSGGTCDGCCWEEYECTTYECNCSSCNCTHVPYCTYNCSECFWECEYDGGDDCDEYCADGYYEECDECCSTCKDCDWVTYC